MAVDTERVRNVTDEQRELFAKFPHQQEHSTIVPVPRDQPLPLSRVLPGVVR